MRESAITGVRRLNALGTAARLGALFAAVRDETAEDLAALPNDAATGLDRLGERCAADVAERLALRRADVSALLCGEAAKRWDGPGGWALRTGGLTSLGLGAGAAIAARNPLLAVGTAAGALAADQVQRALREQRLVRRAPRSVPASGDFGAWYAEALSPARVRAGTPGRRAGRARRAGARDGARAPRRRRSTRPGRGWSTAICPPPPSAAGCASCAVLLDLPVYALAGLGRVPGGVGLLDRHLRRRRLSAQRRPAALRAICSPSASACAAAWRCAPAACSATSSCAPARRSAPRPTRPARPCATPRREKRAALERLADLEPSGAPN